MRRMRRDPVLKLISQLFGDRLLVANATGCSSIYGGNLRPRPGPQPAGTRPGLGKLALRGQRRVRSRHPHRPGGTAAGARSLLHGLSAAVGEPLADAILGATQADEESVFAQRERVVSLKERLATLSPAGNAIARQAAQLNVLADSLVRKSVWIVAATAGRTTSASGGWITCSPPVATSTSWCSTPRSTPTPAGRPPRPPAGRRRPLRGLRKGHSKKDLGATGRAYGNVYVAQIAIGPTMSRPSRRSWRPMPGPDRRW